MSAILLIEPSLTLLSTSVLAFLSKLRSKFIYYCSLLLRGIAELVTILLKYLHLAVFERYYDRKKYSDAGL
jgi:hypothetical protein